MARCVNYRKMDWILLIALLLSMYIQDSDAHLIYVYMKSDDILINSLFWLVLCQMSNQS